MSDTDFWVTPDGLDHQAGGFDAYAEMATSAKQWVESNRVGSSGGHPLYSGAAERARPIEDGLIVFFEHLKQVLDGVGAELRSVATEARTMDVTTAARLDAVDPAEYNDFDPGAPGSASEAQIAPEWDRTDNGTLFPIYQMNGGGIAFYCASDGQYDYINEREINLLPGDLLSPSEWIWTVSGWIGTQSIKDDLLGVFGGRWVELYEFTHMLRGMGTMLEEMRGHVDSCAGALSVYWQGYAANSAQEYFIELSSTLGNAATQLTDASSNFSTFLQGVDDFLGTLADAAHGFIDALMVAAAAAAAGTITAETGVGALAGFGLSGISLLVALNRAYKVWDGIQDAMLLLDILVAVQRLSADLSDVSRSLHIPLMEETA